MSAAAEYYYFSLTKIHDLVLNIMIQLTYCGLNPLSQSSVTSRTFYQRLLRIEKPFHTQNLYQILNHFCQGVFSQNVARGEQGRIQPVRLGGGRFQ